MRRLGTLLIVFIMFPALMQAKNPKWLKNAKKAVVEAGISMGWEKYAGNDAIFITMESFGQSGPAEAVAEFYGFTAEKIAQKIKDSLK